MDRRRRDASLGRGGVERNPSDSAVIKLGYWETRFLLLQHRIALWLLELALYLPLSYQSRLGSEKYTSDAFICRCLFRAMQCALYEPLVKPSKSATSSTPFRRQMGGRPKAPATKSRIKRTKKVLWIFVFLDHFVHFFLAQFRSCSIFLIPSIFCQNAMFFIIASEPFLPWLGGSYALTQLILQTYRRSTRSLFWDVFFMARHDNGRLAASRLFCTRSCIIWLACAFKTVALKRLPPQVLSAPCAWEEGTANLRSLLIFDHDQHCQAYFISLVGGWSVLLAASNS